MEFYNGKKIFITGHTGFKGAWMCKVLSMANAEVMGYALEPPTNPNLFKISKISNKIKSVIGDIRDIANLKASMMEFQPDIVIHMAAQPIVRESYTNPVYTYETNVMGTVNVMEAIRYCPSVKSVINVTTDKVYKNNEWEWGYRENDVLDGYDPYSNSKSCSELVTSSYKKSFLDQLGIAVSTCRAGNVIGGGDFAHDRIIPDCIKAIKEKKDIIVRNKHSIRPYQHVLEPVMAYLMLAKKQYEDISYASNYNIGPDDCDCVSTGELVSIFCEKWGKDAVWKDMTEKNAVHEAGFLKLDSSKIKSIIGWKSRWHVEQTVEKIIEWTKEYFNNSDVNLIMENQINEYLRKGRR